MAMLNCNSINCSTHRIQQAIFLHCQWLQDCSETVNSAMPSQEVGSQRQILWYLEASWQAHCPVPVATSRAASVAGPA